MDMMARLQDGVTVMLIGMGVVFTFLTIMVFVLLFMTKVVFYLNKLFPEVIQEQKTSRKNTQGNADVEVAVAIAAAMKNM